MKKIKFFQRDAHSGALYLAEWDLGYVQVWEEYSQIPMYKRFNWITFNFFKFEIDLSWTIGTSLTIDLVLLGLGLRIYQGLSDEETRDKITSWADNAVKNIEAREKLVKDIVVDVDVPDEYRARAAAIIAHDRQQEADGKNTVLW